MRCPSNMHYSRVYFACLIIGMGLNQRRWLKSEGLLGARVYLLFCVGVTRPYGRSPSWQRTLAVIPSIQCGSSIQTRAGMKEAPAGRWESRAALNLDDWNKSLDWNRFITTMCVRRATTTWFIKICGLYSATNIALKHFSPLAECIKMKISLANWQWCQSLITEVVHFYFDPCVLSLKVTDIRFPANHSQRNRSLEPNILEQAGSTCLEIMKMMIKWLQWFYSHFLIMHLSKQIP